MRKAAKQILACAAILLLFCIACRLIFFRQFTVYLPEESEAGLPSGTEAEQVRVSEPEVLQAVASEKRGDYLRVSLVPEKRGDASLLFGPENGGPANQHELRVGRFHTIYDLNTGNFTGDAGVLVAATLFWLLVSAIMLWHFFQAKGPAFYDYGTIYYSGFFLFALSTGLVLLSVTVSHLAHPENYNMYAVYKAISSSSERYMQLTMPLMMLFAAAMAVSNLALLRHERGSLQNVLGLLVSALLIAGEALGWYLFSNDFSRSETELRVSTTLLNTYATVFIYFQCMLTGAIICGIKAARNIPAPDKDFIIILGCWFREDGSLPPLLQSRADTAVGFWRKQREKSGKEAFFIPSGGHGKNETMPEAEAIRRYLLSRGIEDRLILPEAQSLNTYQNMANSGRLIRETDPSGKAMFATSSYHVFRSGLWARQAGLSAEGIGSRTKWWFWPNAFMRETVGLLQKRWKQEILFLLLLIGYFGLLSLIL